MIMHAFICVTYILGIEFKRLLRFRGNLLNSLGRQILLIVYSQTTGDMVKFKRICMKKEKGKLIFSLCSDPKRERETERLYNFMFLV